jgi:hypothetical protein
MRRLLQAFLFAVSGLALCGPMDGCGDDVDVTFSENFRDGQGGSIRISSGGSSDQSNTDPNMKAQQKGAQGQLGR